VSNWLVQRLGELFSSPGLTVQRVSDETRIPRSYISLIKTGRAMPSEEVVRKLARFFGEDEEQWAFETKGAPVMDDLRRKYPKYVLPYARKISRKDLGDPT